MTVRWAVPLAMVTLLVTASCAQQAGTGSGGDQTAASRAVPFGTFLASVQAQTYGDYAGRPGIKVAGRPAFDEMRSYVLAYYRGAHAVRSYVLSGAVFDCLTRDGVTAHPSPAAASASRSGCPGGSVPVRRLTLDQLARFPTLQQFLAKSPGGSGQLPPTPQQG